MDVSEPTTSVTIKLSSKTEPVEPKVPQEEVPDVCVDYAETVVLVKPKQLQSPKTTPKWMQSQNSRHDEKQVCGKLTDENPVSQEYDKIIPSPDHTKTKSESPDVVKTKPKRVEKTKENNTIIEINTAKSAPENEARHKESGSPAHLSKKSEITAEKSVKKAEDQIKLDKNSKDVIKTPLNKPTKSTREQFDPVKTSLSESSSENKRDISQKSTKETAQPTFNTTKSMDHEKSGSQENYKVNSKEENSKTISDSGDVAKTKPKWKRLEPNLGAEKTRENKNNTIPEKKVPAKCAPQNKVVPEESGSLNCKTPAHLSKKSVKNLLEPIKPTECAVNSKDDTTTVLNKSANTIKSMDPKEKPISSLKINPPKKVYSLKKGIIKTSDFDKSVNKIAEMPLKSELEKTTNGAESKTEDTKEGVVGISEKLKTSSPQLTQKPGTDTNGKVKLETKEIYEIIAPIETVPTSFDNKSAKDLPETISNVNLVKPENSNTTTEESNINPEKEEEVDEDVLEMRTMRKEMDTKMLNMEAEFAAGASKIAALRAKMKRLREAAKATTED